MVADEGRGHSAARAAALVAVTAVAALWGLGAFLAAQHRDAGGALLGVGPAAFALVGALVVWQRPGNRLGPLFCAGALLMATLGAGGEYAKRALVLAPGSLPDGRFVAWAADFVAIPAVGVFAGLLPQLFPTGRVVAPRWRLTVWAAWGYIVFGAFGNAFMPQRLESVPQLDNPYAIPSARPLWGAFVSLSLVCGLAALGGGAASLLLRWRRAAGDERQQLKWFLAGIALLPVPLVLHDVATGVSHALFAAVFVLIPVTMGVAILRHRLYDLDLVVRRTAAYALVSGLLAAGYVGVVAASEAVIGRTAGLTVHVTAAVAVALAFQPLRSWVQRAVDRVFYGDRARPYEAVGRLSRRLEAAVAPETVLPTVVETVADALRLPYAAIELYDDGAWVLAAEHGTRRGDPVGYPMAYQAEVVGRLLVCPRDAHEPLQPADDRLLGEFARHAGVAAHAVRATTALLRSRAELVTAREEERRRLRRDLHDGLGPTLAGVTLGLHAARSRTSTDPAGAEQLLASLEAQVEEAVADVRRLVYGLRPPALDEFGLVRAVQMHAARMDDGANGVRVVVDGPAAGLGRLPAAVEVAAYRIVTEALTNVARHAQARNAAVRFTLDGALEIEVSDDGRGLDATRSAGVGLTAMRERAAELGGTLRIESCPDGARIRARLPVLALR